MATAISLAEVPRPSDIEAEVLYAIDARQKLKAAIESENWKRDAAEIEITRIVSKEISGSPVVNVDAVFQRNEAGKAAAERAKQRIEALESILEKVNKHLEQLKADFPEAVRAALTRRVETLEKALLEKEVEGNGFNEEIKKLKAEISKLPKGTAKKASSSY